jgi:vitamin B12/bleomycin/antimicrobial peptide transport system ATP-binding/permease protein
MLSLGEQQRLGIARVLLHPPDYLLLDEATASLDEAAEAALYRLLQERLKGKTIISIGHRSTLGAFNGRRIALTADDGFHQARDVTLLLRPSDGRQVRRGVLEYEPGPM